MVQRDGRRVGSTSLLQYPHLLGGVAGRANIDKCARSDQEVVTIREVLYTQESCVRWVSKQGDMLRLQVHLKGVAVTFRHEGYLLPIGRPSGTFTKEADLLGISGEVIWINRACVPIRVLYRRRRHRCRSQCQRQHYRTL